MAFESPQMIDASTSCSIMDILESDALILAMPLDVLHNLHPALLRVGVSELLWI